MARIVVHDEGGVQIMPNRIHPVFRIAVEPLRSLSVSRYDLQLGLIPAAFGSAILVAGLSTVTLEVALVMASLIGLLVIVDGLFRNPPSPIGAED